MWKSLLGGLVIGLIGLFFSANLHFVSSGEYILQCIFSLLLFLTVVLSALGLEILRQVRRMQASKDPSGQVKPHSQQ